MAVLGGGMLAGCVAAEEQVEENEAPAPDEEGGPAESVASEPEPEPAAHGGRALVAVFSYSGNTFSVAERIAEATGCLLYTSFPEGDGGGRSGDGGVRAVRLLDGHRAGCRIGRRARRGVRYQYPS